METAVPASKRNKAMLQILCCSALWSIAGIFIKHVPWNPLAIAGSRSVIAAGVFALYMAHRGIKFKVSRQSLMHGAALFATMLSFVAANKLTTSANAIVFQFTAPVYILLYSAVFKRQKLAAADVLVVILALGGISLFFLDKLASGRLLGDVIALASGVFFAATTLTATGTDEESRMNGQLQGHAFTALVGLPFLFIVDTPFTAQAVTNIFILGVFQLGIPYVLFALGTQYCPPLAALLLTALEPLLNPLWVFIFDGEAPGMLSLVGGAIVIASITLWSLKDRGSAKKQPTA